MSKKQILIICSAAGGAVLLIFACIFGWTVWKNISKAKQRAAEMTAYLKDGNLQAARAGYYMEETKETEEGNFVSVQYMADQFGLEALTAGTEEDDDRELLRKVMEYSRISLSAGMTASAKTTVTLRRSGPVLSEWLAEKTEYEAADILGDSGRMKKELSAALEAGTVPFASEIYRVAAQKQNGMWRFAITEEVENALYGGFCSI